MTKIWIRLDREISEFGMGRRQVDYVGCNEKVVLLKKGKHRKVISRAVFESVYNDTMSLTTLYETKIEGRVTVRPTLRRKSTKESLRRAKVYSELRKVSPTRTISMDIVDGVLKNMENKQC